MSAGAPSDIQQGEAGFEEQASPSIPDYRSGEFPMGDAGVDAEMPEGTSEQASEGAAFEGFAEDDINFLQSDEVREYLRNNPPEGFLTKDQHEERIRNFQSSKDREVSTARRQLQQTRDNLSERETQLAVLVQGLRQAWQEAGYEPGSEEYQQREASVLQMVNNAVNERKVQTQQQTGQIAQYLAQHAANTNNLLNAAGLSTVGNPDLLQMVRSHIDRIRNQEFSSRDEVENAQARLIAEAKQRFGQSPQQQRPPQGNPAPAPQGQPRQQPRQNFGPGPGPRGGGGASPPSYEDAYEQGRQQLIQQHGSWANVPQDDLMNLDMHARLRSLGIA